jgi:hypothetical protein
VRPDDDVSGRRRHLAGPRKRFLPAPGVVAYLDGNSVVRPVADAANRLGEFIHQTGATPDPRLDRTESGRAVDGRWDEDAARDGSGHVDCRYRASDARVGAVWTGRWRRRLHSGTELVWALASAVGADAGRDLWCVAERDVLHVFDDDRVVAGRMPVLDDAVECARFLLARLNPE